MKLFETTFFILILVIISLPVSAEAYNALRTHEDGEPVTWDNSKPIQYYLDPGTYGRFTNEQAHTLLKEAMRVWENVPTANVPKFEFAGYLSEDVNKDNYNRYVDLLTCFTENFEYCDNLETHQTTGAIIIFDEDKYILQNELCLIEECVAESGFMTYDGNLLTGIKYIVQGQAVFGPSPYDTAGTVALFAHELGHLLGLSHTSLNQQVVNVPALNDFDAFLFMASMDAVTGRDSVATTLNPDDIAGISALYPADAFNEETATVKGSIKKSDDTQMPEVNVIARNIEDPVCRAYSFITSRHCPHPGTITRTCFAPDGSYVISGLPPGNYTVEVEEMSEEDQYYTSTIDGSLAGDAEFWNEGDQAAEDPYTYTVISLAAGEIRENVDIILNRSEVTEDRVKYIPLDVILGYFPMPAVTACTDTTVDYAALIGIDEGGNDAPTSGGCSLIVPR